MPSTLDHHLARLDKALQAVHDRAGRARSGGSYQHIAPTDWTFQRRPKDRATSCIHALHPWDTKGIATAHTTIAARHEHTLRSQESLALRRAVGGLMGHLVHLPAVVSTSCRIDLVIRSKTDGTDVEMFLAPHDGRRHGHLLYAPYDAGKIHHICGVLEGLPRMDEGQAWSVTLGSPQHHARTYHHEVRAHDPKHAVAWAFAQHGTGAVHLRLKQVAAIHPEPNPMEQAFLHHAAPVPLFRARESGQRIDDHHIPF